MSGFSFHDLPQTAPDAYGSWLFISRLAGFGDLFGIKSPPIMIVPAALLCIFVPLSVHQARARGSKYQSGTRRTDHGAANAKPNILGDLLAIGVGGALYAIIVFYLHYLLFSVPVLPS